nr:hypothetical protein CFP56_12965 [Quercus suber]
MRVCPSYRHALGGDLGRGRAEAVAVAEEEDVGVGALGALVGLDPLAPAGGAPDGLEEAEGAAADVGAVVVAHDLLDGLGGLVGVVEGDGGDVVVQHVGLDDAVHEVAPDEAELAVDGGGGAAGERPGEEKKEGGSERLTEPVVHPQVGDEVPDGQVRPAVGLAEEAEDGGGDEQAEVGQQDEGLVLALVERAAGREVVDAAVAVLLAGALALDLLAVVVVAGGVHDQVHGPAGELLAEEHGDGVEGGLLEQLVHLVEDVVHAGGVLLAGAGQEDHVALHVAGGLVVLAVADLPAEVGDEQGGVEDPADGVVEGLAGGEGLVAALVGEHPEAGTDQALQDGVQGPAEGAEGERGHVGGGAEGVEEVEGGGQAEDVAEHVAHASQAGPLEAVFGDGIADVLDGVLGHAELVAVGVVEDALGVLREVVDGAERGQGGGGGGGGGGVERGAGIGARGGGGDGFDGDVTSERHARGQGGGGAHRVAIEPRRGLGEGREWSFGKVVSLARTIGGGWVD